MGNNRKIAMIGAGCVEVPTFADDTGLHPTRVGCLPPQCAALNSTQVNVQILAAEAALAGNPEPIVHALALDPLTGAVCTLKQIRDMAAEMLEAQRAWLPQFAGKRIVPRPAIHIPAATVAIKPPPDPAQALLKRFIRLAEKESVQ